MSPAELNATIDSLLAQATYEEEIQRFLSLTAKQATIETQNDPDTLADNEEYQALVEEVESTHKQANEEYRDPVTGQSQSRRPRSRSII